MIFYCTVLKAYVGVFSIYFYIHPTLNGFLNQLYNEWESDKHLAM